MQKIIKAFYLAITPKIIIRIKTQCKEYLYWNHIGKQVKREILAQYKQLSDYEIPEDHLSVVRFLKKNKLKILPYDFPKRYCLKEVKVFSDPFNGLRYTCYEEKKIYFKRSWSVRKIKKYFNYLLIEQDVESPHKYMTSGFNVEENEIVVDAGAAEGFFSLNIIDKAAKIYLFEPDLEWIEALAATFTPWKDKIVIIPKYLGANNNSNTVKLDNYFASMKAVAFMKIDVEGHEQEVLAGSERLISASNSLKIAVCTYHRQNDEMILRNYLESKNFNVTYSDGYVIFFYDKDIGNPFLRRCLIRAVKK